MAAFLLLAVAALSMPVNGPSRVLRRRLRIEMLPTYLTKSAGGQSLTAGVTGR